jgi:hypothetical protein
MALLSNGKSDFKTFASRTRQLEVVEDIGIDAATPG